MEILSSNVNDTGLVTRTSHDAGTNRFIIKHCQDIEPSVEMVKRMRNDNEYWKNGVKNSWAHVAHIPEIVIIELLNIGVNVYTASLKDILGGLRKIGKDHFITTTKRVA